MVLSELFNRRRPCTLPPVDSINGLIIKLQHPQSISGKEYVFGPPFDIKVGDDGFTLIRKGNKLFEDLGYRVFIVDNPTLDAIYRSHYRDKLITPDSFYETLKGYSRINGDFGRRLALSDDGIVHINGGRFSEGYTIIVKKIDHPKAEKFHIPDEARYRFTPKSGFKEQVVEKIIPWFKDFKIDLSSALDDVETLSIKEPANSPELREFYKTLGYDNDKIDRILDEKDAKNGFFRTNRNILLVKSLRENMGTIPALPIDINIYKNKMGDLLTRIDGDSGVDGISINGQEVCKLDPRIGFLEVPLMGKNKITNVKYFYHTEKKSMRRALEFNLVVENGRVYAYFVAGIEEIEMPAFDSAAGIIKHDGSDHRKSEEKKENKDVDLRKFQEIGSSIGLFQPVTAPVQAAREIAYKPGDEGRLHNIISDLIKQHTST